MLLCWLRSVLLCGARAAWRQSAFSACVFCDTLHDYLTDCLIWSLPGAFTTCAGVVYISSDSFSASNSVSCSSPFTQHFSLNSYHSTPITHSSLLPTISAIHPKTAQNRQKFIRVQNAISKISDRFTLRVCSPWDFSSYSIYRLLSVLLAECSAFLHPELNIGLCSTFIRHCGIYSIRCFSLRNRSLCKLFIIHIMGQTLTLYKHNTR